MGLPSDSGLDIQFKWKAGRRNLITDVPGVKVGQVTIQKGEVNTGVTAILPHGGNLFQEKVMAGVSVINGFGKSTGLVQVEELGTIESPIILTNTLSTGTALTAMVKYMMEQNPDIGIDTGTVNCIVTECNDGRLNDIRGLHVQEDDVLQAVSSAAETFDEGAVGGGTGMVCLGLKGGIGSSSRSLQIDGHRLYGGRPGHVQFRRGGKPCDRAGVTSTPGNAPPAAGGTPAPSSSSWQRTFLSMSGSSSRVAKRSMIALGRVGSYCGNGSGDIAIAFTTANNLPHYSKESILNVRMFYDENIDWVFEAAVEAVEEAIVSSLYHARTTTGVRGNTYMGLREFLEQYEAPL